MYLEHAQSRECGNALFVVLLGLSLLAALSAADFMVQQKDLKQSNFTITHSTMRRYADSGIELALHGLNYDTSGNEGKIGTQNWTAADDLGRDGAACTYDEGEGDGLPTPGEPHVSPVPFGCPSFGATLIAHTEDVSFEGQEEDDPTELRLVVVTATNGDALVTVKAYAKKIPLTVPRPSALYVPPSALLVLDGNAFKIDGNDASGPGASLPGLSTAADSEYPGDNKAVLIAQIDPQYHNNIQGEGAQPSVGEVDGLAVDSILKQWKYVATNLLEPGSYAGIQMGDADSNNLEVTYVNGDLTLTSGSSGAGVLVVEGSLYLREGCRFQGLVLVRGDLSMGGGSQILGVALVATSFSTGAESTTGSAKITFNSAILDKIEEQLARSTFRVVYYETS
jgi:hypothetical protein